MASAYEQARQEKIAKNRALLQQLQLDAQQAGVGGSTPRPRPAPSAGQKRKRDGGRREVKEEAPRRTSSRLKGLVADSEAARAKQEEEAQAFRDAQVAQRQRVSGDIHLAAATLHGTRWLSAVGPAEPGERTCGARDVADTADTADPDLKALRERMSRLQLWPGAEPSRIKITPERIYALGFHATRDKPLVFAGDKLGSVGLFDASVPPGAGDAEPGDDEAGDDGAGPAITTFKIHTRTVSALHFAPHDHNALYSASYDSSIRKLDLAKAVAVEAYAPADPAADAPLSGVHVTPLRPDLLHFTTLDGHFGIKDVRAPTHQAVERMRLSEKKIGGFSLHPAHPHLLATASLDRTLKLWDLRQLGGGGGGAGPRVPHLVGEHASPLSVSHAAFNAAGHVATASYDDTVKIYDFADAGGWPAGHSLPARAMAPAAVVPHNNQTGRWVTILRAQWQAHPADGIQRFVIGNMNRSVDIYTARGQPLAQLGGHAVTAVPAVAQFHPTIDWVAAGTASGKLCLWQ